MEFVCSHDAPNAAWRVPKAAPYKILSDTRLPYITDRFGRKVLYWHMANEYPGLGKWCQILLLRDAIDLVAHELWPIAFVGTEFREGAEETIYWVSDDDLVHMPDGTSFKSPFLFSKSPGTLAVQYSFSPGYEFSLDCFINARYAWAVTHAQGKYSLTSAFQHEFLHGMGADHTTRKGDILEAIYNPNGVITEDTRAVLNILQGADRLEALEADPAGRFIIKNILERAGLAKELKKPTSCLAKLKNLFR